MGGTDLAKALALYISKRAFHKCFRDCQELERRYKGRPKQLKQLKRRTTKVFDERRQCFLYEDPDSEGESLTPAVEAATKQLIAVRPCIFKPYVPRSALTPSVGWQKMNTDNPSVNTPSYLKLKLGKLKARLDRARAAADAALAEDEDEVVPPVVRQILILSLIHI